MVSRIVQRLANAYESSRPTIRSGSSPYDRYRLGFAACRTKFLRTSKQAPWGLRRESRAQAKEKKVQAIHIERVFMKERTMSWRFKDVYSSDRRVSGRSSIMQPNEEWSIFAIAFTFWVRDNGQLKLERDFTSLSLVIARASFNHSTRVFSTIRICSSTDIANYLEASPTLTPLVRIVTSDQYVFRIRRRSRQR